MMIARHALHRVDNQFAHEPIDSAGDLVSDLTNVF
jgi:hypothetical protein